MWTSVRRFDREAIFEMRSDGLEQTGDRVRVLAGFNGIDPPCFGPSLGGVGWV